MFEAAGITGIEKNESQNAQLSKQNEDWQIFSK
jgi:hypothetical protein